MASSWSRLSMQPIQSAPTSPNQSMSIPAGSPLQLLLSMMMGKEMHPGDSPDWLPELKNQSINLKKWKEQLWSILKLVLILKKASLLYRMWWMNLTNGCYLLRTTTVMMTQTNMWVLPQLSYTFHLLDVNFSGHICLHFLYAYHIHPLLHVLSFTMSCYPIKFIITLLKCLFMA